MANEALNVSFNRLRIQAKSDFFNSLYGRAKQTGHP